ncbi:unnamed protein product [Caretta caretta]
MAPASGPLPPPVEKGAGAGAAASPAACGAGGASRTAWGAPADPMSGKGESPPARGLFTSVPPGAPPPARSAASPCTPLPPAGGGDSGRTPPAPAAEGWEAGRSALQAGRPRAGEAASSGVENPSGASKGTGRFQQPSQAASTIRSPRRLLGTFCNRLKDRKN